MRKMFLMLFLVATTTAFAQTNFTLIPEKPRAGETVTFTYKPSGDIASSTAPIEATLYQYGKTLDKADDIEVKKVAGSYVGSITLDTAASFIVFGFTSDGKTDNNYNEGYKYVLEDGDKARPTGFYNQSIFYQFNGQQVGVEANLEKALESIQNEFSLYPENKKGYLWNYSRLQAQLNKDDAAKIYQKEIEDLLKSGLKEESDYNMLQNLYELAKLPQQSKMVVELKKLKFPNGTWTVTEEVDKYAGEKDIDKKKELLASLLQKATADPEKWKQFLRNEEYYRSQIPRAYMAKKDWPNFKKEMEASGIKGKLQLAGLYNSAAWSMQETSDNLPYAREFASKATQLAKEEWKTPSKKPDYYSQKQWDNNLKSTYGMYADTYAMVEYRLGNYKSGYALAKESAIVIGKGKDAELNATYAQLAEKALSKKESTKIIEGMVKDGKSTAVMKDILKRAYVAKNKSEDGFDDYIVRLQKDSYLKMMEELRKSMINETTPSFALLNLDGKKVDIADLKGKVVVVDFWATWCGPCKASFPGMQKVVTKYKDDPNVKFIFVDTWERGEEKEKNAKEFIVENKYTFDVLMDNDDKVVEDFKVEGIPTKFVIDKAGKIRFRTMGGGSNEDKLMNELTAMIEMAGNPEKKGF